MSGEANKRFLDPAFLAGGAVLFLALGALAWAARGHGLERAPQIILDFIAAMGPWAPLLVIGLYVVLVPLCLPGGPFTVGAGFMLGAVRGTLAVTIGTALGASVAFVLARGAMRGVARRRLEGRRWVLELDRAVSEEGWKVVLLSRMIPFFPFKLSNYAFGLTEISFRGFFLGTLLGVIPLSALNCYLGALAASAATETRAGAAQWAFRAATLAALVAAAVYATRLAKRVWERGRGGK